MQLGRHNIYTLFGTMTAEMRVVQLGRHHIYTLFGTMTAETRVVQLGRHNIYIIWNNDSRDESSATWKA